MISFEWTGSIEIESDFASAKALDIDAEIIQIIRRDEPKPKPDLPTIEKVIDIVPDDVEIEDVDFSNEVTRQTEYRYIFDLPEPVEVIDDDPIPFINVEDKPTFNGGDPIVEFGRYSASS